MRADSMQDGLAFLRLPAFLGQMQVQTLTNSLQLDIHTVGSERNLSMNEYI